VLETLFRRAFPRVPVFDLFKRKPAQEPAATSDVPPPHPTPEDLPQSDAKRSWSERLKSGLGVSRARLSGAVSGAFRRRVLDDQALDELESALLTADVGVEATAPIRAHCFVPPSSTCSARWKPT
jgi:signal recognition particle GTPase